MTQSLPIVTDLATRDGDAYFTWYDKKTSVTDDEQDGFLATLHKFNEHMEPVKTTPAVGKPDTFKWPEPEDWSMPIPVELVRDDNDEWYLLVDGIRSGLEMRSMESGDSFNEPLATTPPPFKPVDNLLKIGDARRLAFGVRLESEAKSPAKVQIVMRQVVECTELERAFRQERYNRLDVSTIDIDAYRASDAHAPVVIASYPFWAPCQSSVVIVAQKKVDEANKNQPTTKSVTRETAKDKKRPITQAVHFAKGLYKEVSELTGKRAVDAVKAMEEPKSPTMSYVLGSKRQSAIRNITDALKTLTDTCRSMNGSTENAVDGEKKLGEAAHKRFEDIQKRAKEKGTKAKEKGEGGEEESAPTAERIAQFRKWLAYKGHFEELWFYDALTEYVDGKAEKPIVYDYNIDVVNRYRTTTRLEYHFIVTDHDNKQQTIGIGSHQLDGMRAHMAITDLKGEYEDLVEATVLFIRCLSSLAVDRKDEVLGRHQKTINNVYRNLLFILEACTTAFVGEKYMEESEKEGEKEGEKARGESDKKSELETAAAQFLDKIKRQIHVRCHKGH